MSFLIDTNVVSEWVKPRPNEGVVRWLAETDEDRIFLSTVTLAELRYGVERLAAGARRKRLDEWLRDELPLRFEGRVLAVDEKVAEAWGRVVARREAAGRPLAIMDAFLAATAEAHGLTVVTRNVGDFKLSTEAVLNPWTEE
ncbi:MAG TPA: type II toxin-antitoxin system VapC family toxin [Dongiaceae bacterium]|nr:type II toxin-antitoxin system VapC family toxin [Dongiaceae bacterium]